MCGVENPDGTEICPVSDREMRGRGLRHLIAYSRHKRAMDVYRETAQVRRALAAEKRMEGQDG